MYNTYLVPVYDDDVYIVRVVASSLKEAEDKFVERFNEDYNLDASYFDELIELAWDKLNINIGSTIYDKDEL